MERHQPGRLVDLRIVGLLLLGAAVLGCGQPSGEQTAASRPARSSSSSAGRPSTKPEGQTSEYAPPITRQESATPAEKPAEKPAESPVPEQPAALPAAQPAAEPAPAAEAPAKPAVAQAPAAVPEFGQAEPLDLIMPPVLMTDSEAKTCRVKVGDELPDARLTELGDGEKELRSLFGKRLTVVVFWRATHPYAVEELGDLQRLVVGRFKDQDVSVVGVDVKDQPEVVKETVAAKKVEFPNLLDAAGTAYAQVATEFMPRTYLVDAKGKILWFDMEYSRSTRRDLLRAIRATLSVNE